MALPDILFQVALNHVWENPHIDNNVVMRLTQISPSQGSLGEVCLPFSHYILPDARRFALFEVGGWRLESLGIQGKIDNWTPLTDLMLEEKMTAMVFCDGFMFHIKDCYIMKASDENIILAIVYDSNKSILELADTKYLRLYSNIRFSNTTHPLADITMGFFEGDPSSTTDWVPFINQYNAISGGGLKTLIYVNGVYHDTMPPQTDLSIGDRIMYYFDDSIVNEHVLDLNDLPAFFSALDSKQKVILSIPGKDEHIFTDDLEFHVVYELTSGRRVGLYLPRLRYMDIRPLTYKDVSIASIRIDTLVTNLQKLDIDPSDVVKTQVTVHLRNDMEREIPVLDGNRIRDLQNLPVDVRRTAMTSSSGGLGIWRATTLESCNFNKWIGGEREYMANAQALVGNDPATNPFKNVLSRHAAHDLLENIRIDQDTGLAAPPRLVEPLDPIKIFDFTTDGKLDEVNDELPISDFLDLNSPNDNHDDRSLVVPIIYDNEDTIHQANTISNPITLNGKYEYIYYKRQGVDWEYIEPLIEISGDNITVTFNSSDVTSDILIRPSTRFTVEELTVDIDDFRTEGITVYPGGSTPNNIPLDITYIWINHRLMIEGLDYEIRLVNGTFKVFWSSNFSWVTTTTVTVNILNIGASRENPIYKPKKTWGWVRDGMIQVDDNYDLTVYRNKWVFIAGKLVRIDDLFAMEDYRDLISVNANIGFSDGQPWTVIDKPKFSNVTALDLVTDALHDEIELDEQVTTYIEQIHPQVPNTGSITIQSRYDLVSNFIMKVYKEFTLGNVVISPGQDLDALATALSQQYIDVYNADPCRSDLESGLVVIRPHDKSTPISVSPDFYGLVLKINEVLFNDKVEEISTHFTVS